MQLFTILLQTSFQKVSLHFGQFIAVIDFEVLSHKKSYLNIRF